MKRVLLFLLCCALAAFGFVSAPAQASHDGDSIPDEFEVSGWWNNPSNTTDTPDRKWSYNDFPVTCNSDSSQDAFQIIWAHKAGQTPHYLDSVKGPIIEKDYRRVASIFAASAKIVHSNNASLQTNRTPRFLTTAPNSNGRCEVKFESLQVSDAVYNGGYTTLWDEIHARGYNNPNRKYIVVTNTYGTCGDCTYQGIAEIPGYSDGADKTAGNDANSSSDIHFVHNNAYQGDLAAVAIAHEIMHSLGAVNGLSPNRNTQNSAHPADCMDIVCYRPLSTAGQYDACGNVNYSNPEAFRIDCNKNDYFNKAPGSGNHLYTHFNIATDSTFIFGGKDGSALRVQYKGARTSDPAFHH